MKVLVACEMSGRVRDQFIARGHEAVSCDVLPSLTPGPHLQRDVLEVIHEGWDLMVGFPPCTYLSNVGAQYWPKREQEQQDALLFAEVLWTAPISKIALENPLGRISWALGPASQWIQPWMFGDPFTKRTGLWLKGLPKLEPTHDKPKQVQRWIAGNDHTRGTIGLGVAKKHERSLTFPGVARAMAGTWG